MASPSGRLVRILFANHTADWSGAEVALMRLLTRLSADHDCAVAAPAPGRLPEILDAAGIRRFEIPAGDLSLRLDAVQTPLGLARLVAGGVRLRAVARRFGADVIHANSLRTGLMGAVAAPLGAPPIVVQVHEHLPLSAAGRATRLVVARTATGVSAVTDYTAANFNQGLREPRAVRAYISIDHERFDPERTPPLDIRAELGLDPGSALIGEVAQITPWKGQDTAIRMLAEIRRERPDTHLLIVGAIAFSTKATRHDNPTYLAGLERMVAELGLEDHVHFLGQRSDVPGLLAALDLMVLPSWDEPFGTVAAESMAMGTPPMVSSIGGVPEYVEDGVSGRVLPPREPLPWARAALELLADRERLEAMGRRARTVAARFTDERYGDALLAAYERAIAARTAART
jgi:glycosyltransferase involved in cell wall biosynthesis